MLTGDENIVDINFSVFWVIKDAQRYLFNIRAPESTVKSAAESAMREVVGRSEIQAILTGRSFFPGLITAPFKAGLDAAFDFAILASLVAAGASWMRGGRYVYVEQSSVKDAGEKPTETVEGSPVTDAVLTAASGTTTARDGNR